MIRKQEKALTFLWFKYGNGGAYHTKENHKFLKAHIEGKPDEAKLQEHLITTQCREAFSRVMADDYGEFHGSTLAILDAVEKGYV